jgi:DNA repair exonuclease SbcCD nuclease subunit
MKIIAISDPHFHPFQQFSELIDGVSSRLLDVKRTFDAAVDLGVKEGCQLMLIPGDIFHVRGSVKPSVLNIVLGCFERAMENFPVVVIPGNHDMEDKEGGPTAVDFLRTLPNVYVMGQPSRLTIRDLPICGIPYQHNLAAFENAVKGLDERLRNCNVFMVHQGIDDLADKGVPETGLTVKKLRELLGEDCLILAGHYHRPLAQQNVVQVGAPLQHNFGDEGQERGAWVFELSEEGKLISSKFLPINVAPKFETVTDDYESSMMLRPGRYEGSFLRLKLSSAVEAKKAIELIKPKAATVVIEREYSSVHGVAMKIGSVQEMVGKFFELSGVDVDEAANALKLYTEICK